MAIWHEFEKVLSQISFYFRFKESISFFFVVKIVYMSSSSVFETMFFQQMTDIISISRKNVASVINFNADQSHVNLWQSFQNDKFSSFDVQTKIVNMGKIQSGQNGIQRETLNLDFSTFVGSISYP